MAAEVARAVVADTVAAEVDKAVGVDEGVKVVGAEVDKAEGVDEEVKDVADKDQKVARPCNLQL